MVFIALLLLVEVMVGVLAIQCRSNIQRRVQDDMIHSLRNIKNNNEVFINSRLTWDELQVTVSFPVYLFPLDDNKST